MSRRTIEEGNNSCLLAVHASAAPSVPVTPRREKSVAEVYHTCVVYYPLSSSPMEEIHPPLQRKR